MRNLFAQAALKLHGHVCSRTAITLTGLVLLMAASINPSMARAADAPRELRLDSKSTLLRIICGLDRNYRGEVKIRGSAPDPRSHEVGLIFQEPRLLPWLSVADNVAFGRGRGRHPHVRQLLAEVGLQGYAEVYPKQLSGGMAQRVAIARGLFTQPALLLLDEPFSAVDAMTRMRLQDLLLSVALRHGITMLLITHDIAEAAYLSDRIIALSSRPGRVRGHIDVDVPRVRERHSPALANVEARAFAHLYENAGAASSIIAA